MISAPHDHGPPHKPPVALEELRGLTVGVGPRRKDCRCSFFFFGGGGGGGGGGVCI